MIPGSQAATALFSPFALGWLASALTVAIALRAPRRPYPLPPAIRHPAYAPLLVGLVVAVTRLVLRPRFVGDRFYGDENLSGCVASYQLLQGERLWSGYAHHLSYVAYLAAYRVFGFGPPVARLANIFAVAVAGAVLHVGVRRATDARSAWIVSLMIVIAGPYVAQSLFGTEIGLSLVPPAIALLLLAGPVTPLRVFSLGPLAAAAMFVYPSSPIAIAGLGVAHALVFRARWSRPARFAAVAGFGAAMILVPLVCWSITGQVRSPEWSLWRFDLGFAPAGLGMLLRDVLWESRSFDAINLGAPYLDPALLGFAIVGAAAGWRERDARWRWAWVGVLAFLGAILAASLTGAEPGIRRAFAAAPLLGFAIARGLLELRRRASRPLVVLVAIVAAMLVSWHTARLVASWPVLPEPDFLRGARALLAAEQMAGHDVVVVGEHEDGYGGEAWRCALGLDERLAPRLGHIRAVQRAGLENLRDAPRGPTVVLASQPIAEHDLATAFGRPPSETILRHPPDSDLLGLRVVYLLEPLPAGKSAPPVATAGRP